MARESKFDIRGAYEQALRSKNGGARRLIAPRMHPYWIRNKAGAVVFVCRETCTGRVTGG